MHDKVIHVVIMHQEVAELPGQHLLDAALLCADEALNHHTAKHTKINNINGTKLVSQDQTHMQCLCCYATHSTTYMPGTCGAYSPIKRPAHQELPQSQWHANLPDGAVNIMLIHILPQVHHCTGFRHAEHALQVPHSHRHAMTDSCLFAQSSIHLQAPCSCLMFLAICAIPTVGHA